MNKITKVFIAVLVIALVATPALVAQNVKLEAKLNVAAADNSTYFNWSIGSEKINDKVDATSGASIAASTAAFDKVRYDGLETKKPTLPTGLRGLVLYPIADFGTTTYDALSVKEEGKALVVRYVHRGTAYELTTDTKGRFDVLTGARLAKGLADNIGGAFVLKPEFVKDGGDPTKMSALDWSKITLVADTKDPSATRWYEGTVSFAYKKDILTLKGALTEKK